MRTPGRRSPRSGDSGPTQETRLVGRRAVAHEPQGLDLSARHTEGDGPRAAGVGWGRQRRRLGLSTVAVTAALVVRA